MEDQPPEITAPSRIENQRARHLIPVVLLGVLGMVGAVLLFVFDPAQHAFYPVCLFKKLTGYDCPGCGGLRAMHHLLRGDVREAFQLNALAVIALPLLVLWMARALWRSSRRGPMVKAPVVFLAWFLLAVVVIFGVVRNLPIWPFGVTPG